MKRLHAIAIACLMCVAASAQEPRTEITKWQDGKLAAVSITFDDSTINQFRIALPMLNERGLPATFFVITGEIPGSEYRPMFVGRPVMEIIRESAKVPTNKDNALERSSMLRYLGEVQRIEIVLKNFRPNSAAGLIEKGQFAEFDKVLSMLRESGETYASVRSRLCRFGRRKTAALPPFTLEGLRGMSSGRPESRATRSATTSFRTPIHRVWTSRTSCTKP